MADKIILRSGNPLALLRSAHKGLPIVTVEGAAGKLSCSFLGAGMAALSRLVPWSTQPHFTINGFLGPCDDWRTEVCRLLFSSRSSVSLSLYYESNDKLSFTSRALTETGASFGLSRFGAKKDQELPAWRRGIFERLAQLLSDKGIELRRTSRGNLEAPIQTDVSLVYPMERVRVWGKALDLESMKEIFLALTEVMDDPDRVHATVHASFEFVRDLASSGSVMPCACCEHYLGYNSPGAPDANIDPERVLEVGQVLVDEAAKDKFLTFGDFTWKHQDPETRDSGGNLLQWIVKPDQSTLRAWWMGKFSRKGWEATEEAFWKALHDEESG